VGLKERSYHSSHLTSLYLTASQLASFHRTICVPSLALIARVVFLLKRERTDTQAKSQMPLITVPTHRLPLAWILTTMMMMLVRVVIATPVATDAITVKRLRHGGRGSAELKWTASVSDGAGLILYVVEGISISSSSSSSQLDKHVDTAHWTILTRVWR